MDRALVHIPNWQQQLPSVRSSPGAFGRSCRRRFERRSRIASRRDSSDASNCSIFSEVITHDVAKLRRDGRLNVVAGIRRQDLLEALRQRSRVYLEVSQFNCQCGHGGGGCKVEPYSSHYRLIQLGFIFGVQTKHMYLVSFLKCAMFHLTALNSNIGFKNRHYLVHRV